MGRLLRRPIEVDPLRAAVPDQVSEIAFFIARGDNLDFIDHESNVLSTFSEHIGDRVEFCNQIRPFRGTDPRMERATGKECWEIPQCDPVIRWKIIFRLTPVKREHPTFQCGKLAESVSFSASGLADGADNIARHEIVCVR